MITNATRTAPPPENGHARHQLVEKIVAESVADRWDRAKLEWKLGEIYFTDRDSAGTCLCGHTPIIEHCVLVNRENGKTVVVGNVCVTKFLGLSVDKLFRELRKIAKDEKHPARAELIEYAAERGWINSWEREFSLNTIRFRWLSEKQLAVRVRINSRILDHARAAGVGCGAA